MTFEMSVIVIVNFEMLLTTIVVAGKKRNRELSHSEGCDHKQLSNLKFVVQIINSIY